jgi:hypothetical protein
VSAQQPTNLAASVRAKLKNSRIAEASTFKVSSRAAALSGSFIDYHDPNTPIASSSRARRYSWHGKPTYIELPAMSTF